MQQNPHYGACASVTRVDAGTRQVTERLFFATAKAEVRPQSKPLGQALRLLRNGPNNPLSKKTCLQDTAVLGQAPLPSCRRHAGRARQETPAISHAIR